MGFYRLLLAFCVVYSHTDGNLLNYNFGVSAVISFYLLSGLFMTALLTKYYSSPSLAGFFYLDRFTRLMPQFLLYTSLMLVAAMVGLRHPWMRGMPTPLDVAKQFSPFMLNFYRNFPNMLLPQAWSLGLESFFYLTFPFVLALRLRPLVALVSFVIYMRSYFDVIDTDLHGYRYLPGTYFIFIAGSYLYTLDRRGADRLAGAVSIGAAILLVTTYIKPELNLPYIRSVLAGLSIGVLVVSRLVRFEMPKVLDDLAGNVSYGVFLNHVLVLTCLRTYEPSVVLGLPNPFLSFPFVCILSCLLSYCSFAFVERPLIRLRRSLRHEKRADGHAAAPKTSAI